MIRGVKAGEEDSPKKVRADKGQDRSKVLALDLHQVPVQDMVQGIAQDQVQDQLQDMEQNQNIALEMYLDQLQRQDRSQGRSRDLHVLLDEMLGEIGSNDGI
jgi:hypothetical protein